MVNKIITIHFDSAMGMNEQLTKLNLKGWRVVQVISFEQAERATLLIEYADKFKHLEGC